MVRPLTGNREVMRRLQERNEARHRRTNEVREMGGLEPLPDAQERIFGTYPGFTYGGDELQQYLDRASNFQANHYQRVMFDSLFMGEGLQQGQLNLIAGRSRPGRSNIYEYARQITEERYESSLRGISASNITFDEYDYDPMLPDMFNSDIMELHLGNITREEYDKRKKLKALEGKTDANNKDFKFVLEAEY
jgi:hypothetical protein